MRQYNLPVVIEQDKDGFFAFCPELQGCYTQGETYEEVLENIKDAIILQLRDRVEENESIPDFESVSLSTVRVTL